MSFLLEMCPTKTLGSLCVESGLHFLIFHALLPLFLGNGKNQRPSLEKELCPRKQALAEPPPPLPQVEPNAKQLRVLRVLTHEQLPLVDVYKSENLTGGKYFDPSVLREFGVKTW